MFKRNKTLDADTKSFKDVTANMTKREKWGYFWTYYKLHVFGTLTVVGVAIWFIHSLIVSTHVYLEFAMVNGFAYLNERVVAVEDGEYFVGEPTPGIWISDDLHVDLADLLIDESERSRYIITTRNHNLNNPQTVESFVTLANLGIIDVIITYPADMQTLANVGHFHDLTIFDWNLPEHVFYNDNAIHLNYFPFLLDHVVGGEDLILGIASNSDNLERIHHFFNKLLEP